MLTHVYSCFMLTGSCSPNPCKNAASCTVAPYGYVCTCVAGYKGRHCETGIVYLFNGLEYNQNNKMPQMVCGFAREPLKKS